MHRRTTQQVALSGRYQVAAVSKAGIPALASELLSFVAVPFDSIALELFVTSRQHPLALLLLQVQRLQFGPRLHLHLLALLADLVYAFSSSLV